MYHGRMPVNNEHYANNTGMQIYNHKDPPKQNRSTNL